MRKQPVSIRKEIAKNIDTFNLNAKRNLDSVAKILTHPRSQYWVYDDTFDRFAPSKYCGYREMTFSYYASYAGPTVPGYGMDGGTARKAIEKAMEAVFERREELHDGLREWATKLCGEDVLNRSDVNWKFIVCPEISDPSNHQEPRSPHLQVVAIPDEDDESANPEGATKYGLHRYYERDRPFIKRLKAKRLAETGKLLCEACSFDFAATYGLLHEGFIEAHHEVPVATLRGKGKTKASDIALVCSNCHRILHHEKGLTVPKLRERIRRNAPSD